MKSELTFPESDSEEPSRSGGHSVIEPEISAAAPGRAEKFPLKIPPILLEGDGPEPAAISEDSQKFPPGPAAPAKQLETEGELPEAYGTEKLLLTARDPHWLYAHWDLTRERQHEHCARAVDGRLTLRVYRGETAGQPVAEVQVHPGARHWFVHVENSGTPYAAELGYVTAASEWTPISVSDPTRTPPDAMSHDTSAEFASIPFEMPMAKMLSLVESAATENLPLAKALQELSAQGHPELPASPPLAKWTAGQQRALAEVAGTEHVRQVSMGSMEVTELIQPQFGEELSSQGAPAFSTGISSPPGGWQPEKSFWLNVNAELIIYGATDPNATVTLGGRPIKLRPDGSFSYRFALLDGNYELAVVAVSADQTDARAAELKFSRATELRGAVGIHPQNPELKTPEPKNISTDK